MTLADTVALTDKHSTGTLRDHGRLQPEQAHPVQLRAVRLSGALSPGGRDHCRHLCAHRHHCCRHTLVPLQVWYDSGRQALLLTISLVPFSLPAYCLLATGITFYAAWSLHIRLLLLSGTLLFLEVAFKLVGLIVLSHDRVTIYNTCYLTGTCEYDNWRIQMVQLANGIAFLFPSTLISFINMISVMYLIYLFRSNNRQ